MGWRHLDRDGMGQDQRPSRLHHLLAAMGRPGGPVLGQPRGAAFSAISGDQFLTWGWRVPFWLSIVMVGIGLYIRLGILETPVFSRILERTPRRARAGASKSSNGSRSRSSLTALARMAEQGPFYVFAAFVFVYGTKVSGSSRDFLLAAVMVATALSAVTTPLAGHISDRIGRKRMYLIGAVTIGRVRLYLFRNDEHHGSRADLSRDRAVLHPARHDVRPAGGLDRRMLLAAATLQRLLARLTISPRSSPAARRRSIATALFAASGSGYVVALYILFCAIVSITATSFLPDYTNRDISQEHDAALAPQQAAASS